MILIRKNRRMLESNGDLEKLDKTKGGLAPAMGVRPVRVLVGNTRDQGVEYRADVRILAPGAATWAPHLHKRGNHFDRLIVLNFHLTSSGAHDGAWEA
jgi:hypothetical protein